MATPAGSETGSSAAPLGAAAAAAAPTLRAAGWNLISNSGSQAKLGRLELDWLVDLGLEVDLGEPGRESHPGSLARTDGRG
mmetsp:Transcript_57350/g.92935  ORF Transcript_57350/g.92935 Transcript_57350/m.92935 type:complete len:81 (-) Transcript_57350:169-411(-)